jgi:di/tripeptidase
MVRPSHKRTITPAEFAHYAATHDVKVIYPNPYNPRPKGRAERQATDSESLLLPIAKQYAAVLEYYIRVDASNGDTEGANLKRFTLATVNSAIAKVERPA